jgi:hypothetical protein
LSGSGRFWFVFHLHADNRPDKLLGKIGRRIVDLPRKRLRGFMRVRQFGQVAV